MSVADPAVVETRGRDAYIDFVRATGLLTIVLGHWFVGRTWRDDGRVGIHVVVGELPGLWLATWFFVSVPLLLFAGGFANMRLYRAIVGRGYGPGRFLAERATRLALPTGAFLLAWVLAELLMHALGVGGHHAVRLVSLQGLVPFAPLWFIGIYMLIVLLSPLTIALHARFGAAVPFCLLAAACTVDLLRFAGGVPAVGWLNLGLCWLVPHQLGYLYGDGGHRRMPGRGWLAVSLASFGILLMVTGAGLYPRSIGGLPGDPISNMRPPTVVIALLSVCQVALVLALRRQITAVLRSRPVRAAVQGVNAAAMTIYLWHMTALLAALLVLAPLGLSGSPKSWSAWAVQRPAWLVLATLFLVGGAPIASKIERIRLAHRSETHPARR
jgi:fucose 4-O-acetylase-like acetyltransferase